MLKSSSPTKVAPAMSSGTKGRRNSANSYRILEISRVSAKCSSEISFWRATISAGSMKVVFPVALSSYTKPWKARFLADATGMSIFPSRMATEASLSVSPSCCACRRMAFMRLETLISFSLMLRRILYSWSEAVSLISPWRSRMASMRCSTSAGADMPDARCWRLG